MDVNAAFAIAVAGVLLIYGEFIAPGRVIPGLAGALGLLWGAYSLSRHGPSAIGLALLSAALVLFIADAVWETRSLAGIAATLCMVAGSLLLFRSRQALDPALAAPASVLFGTVTLFLCYAARKARKNKRSDL